MAEYQTIVYEVKEGLCVIKLNRPRKKNSFSPEMYVEVSSALSRAAADDDVSVTVITGEGDYYSSGNDLSNFLMIDMSQPDALQKALDDSKHFLTIFVESFIKFPKLLIAAVNGPAFGIAATTIVLCDLIYASSSASFETPFVRLGQSPEGVSSLTFPRIMGLPKANELLLLGRPISAVEAERAHLVTRVFDQSEFRERVMEIAREAALLPKQSLRSSRNLVRQRFTAEYLGTSEQEINLLVERWASEECMAAIMQFFANQKTKGPKAKL